jgi:hypothetical protein
MNSCVFLGILIGVMASSIGVVGIVCEKIFNGGEGLKFISYYSILMGNIFLLISLILWWLG